MFLCERSTILLSEYISLSDDINIISEKSDIFDADAPAGELSLYLSPACLLRGQVAEIDLVYEAV